MGGSILAPAEYKARAVIAHFTTCIKSTNSIPNTSLSTHHTSNISTPISMSTPTPPKVQLITGPPGHCVADKTTAFAWCPKKVPSFEDWTKPTTSAGREFFSEKTRPTSHLLRRRTVL